MFSFAVMISAEAEPQFTSRPKITSKTVSGVVRDEASEPIPFAIVSLKNLRTSVTKSFTSNMKGEYTASGLDFNTDYELQATYEGARSKKRMVSQLDTRPKVVLDLNVPIRLSKKVQRPETTVIVRVTSEGREPVEFAAVKIESLDLVDARTGATDKEGTVRLQVPQGKSYVITVTAAEFEKTEKNLSITAESEVTVEIPLVRRK